MRRWRPAFAIVAALLFAALCLALAGAGAESRATLDKTRMRLAQVRAQRLDPRSIDAMRHALAAPFDPETGLLAGNEVEAASRLETLVRELAQEHKAEVQSLTVTVDTTADKLPVLRGSLHLIVSDDNIGLFVRSLESGPPAVFMERLRIAYRSPSNGGEAPLLDVAASMLVYRDPPGTGRAAP